MTSPTDITDELRSEIYTRFAIAQPSVDLFFENHAVDPSANAIYAICEIMPDLQKRADLNNSNKLICSTGVVNVRVMVPQETGKREGQLVLDSLYEILTDRQFALPGGGHVTLYGADMNTRGEVNGYFAMSISFMYRAFITLTR